MSTIRASSSSYRNWTAAVREATPFGRSWKIENERQLWGRAQLPNDRLKQVFDGYKKRNFGNAPALFTGTVRGREVYIFSVRHGIGNPASTFIHDRAGRFVDN